MKAYTILLADDSQDFRLLVKHHLRDFPCTIVEADSGETAIELFRQSSFDLVLMDVLMPGLSGIEAIGAIRRIEATGKRTPIITLSASSDVMTGLDCLQAGTDRMLLKPIGKRTLVDTVRSVIDAGETH